MRVNGLRFGHDVALSGDTDFPAALVGGEAGQHQIHNPPEPQKGGSLTESPAAPAIAEILASVPVDDRLNRVFELPTRRMNTASAVIAKCSAEAQVIETGHDL